MAIILFLLGLAVFSFLYALRKTAFSGLAEKIKTGSRAARNRRAFRIALENSRPETVTIEGHTLRSEPVAMEDGVRLRIELSSAPLLPIPLEIAKNRTALDSAWRGGRGFYRLGIGDFTSLAAPGDPAFPAREIENELRRLNEVCVGYSLYHDRITCLIPAKSDVAAVKKETYGSLARLASLLVETGKTVDLRLRFLQSRLRRQQNADGLLEILGLLLKYYKNDATTRTLLERLSRHPDFDAAFTAAKELGLDLAQFTIARVAHSDPSNAIKAVKRIRREKFPGALGFLIDYYPHARANAVRAAIVETFKAYADPRAATLLARELGSAGTELVPAVIGALAACGDRGSLAPLHALAADRTRSAPVRAAAEEATAKIRARLGIGTDEEGALSFADAEGPEGGLSKADEIAPDNR